MAEASVEAGQRSAAESDALAELAALFDAWPISRQERCHNMHTLASRQSLARVLFLYEIYQRIVNVPGIIVQCGVRWGGDMVVLAALRTILEPYNYSRRIIGFDTFSGLEGVGQQDEAGSDADHQLRDGQYGVPPGYESFLSGVLAANERLAPLEHICKHELVRGDAAETVPRFLAERPGEMVALLYLDMDIYRPTREVLNSCAERLSKGSVVVFDEYTHRQFPGEAIAQREMAERVRMRLYRSPFSTVAAVGVVDGP